MCLENFSSQKVERHNKPEIEIQESPGNHHQSLAMSIFATPFPFFFNLESNGVFKAILRFEKITTVRRYSIPDPVFIIGSPRKADQDSNFFFV